MKFVFLFGFFLFVKENFDGQIQLNNVEFRYPNRLEVQVLKDFTLTIEPRIELLLIRKTKTV
jgi:ABC-type bacteriocin/lantibiotic exporter with double-glycine peptidase domain